MKALRGDSTPQWSKTCRKFLSGGLFGRGEADDEHRRRQNDVEPGIGRIVRYHGEQHSVGIHKPKDGYNSVDESKDLEPQAGGSGAGHRREQKDNARRDMDDAVHLVHHEDAEKHVIFSDSGNEAEDSNRQEDNTEKHSECFSHRISNWFEKFRLWQGAQV
jgi:hypothetical protein